MTEAVAENSAFDEAWLNERAEYFAGIYEEVMALRLRGAFHNKNIAIVGSWDNAGEINNIITRLGLKLTHIADNNPTKQGVSRVGIISQSVGSLRYERDLVVLVINKWYWKDIHNQLSEMGFLEEQDYYIVYGGEKFKNRSSLASNALSLPHSEWVQLKGYAKEAYASYIALERKYDGSPIWLMHQPSLGDLYIFSLFLPHAMGVNSVAECECVLIVTKSSVRKLAIALGFKYIELITFEDASKKWLLLMRMMGEHLNIKNAVHHGLNSVFQSLVHYSNATFKDSFTKYVFQFQNEVEPIYPVLPKRKEHVLKLFEEHGLILGKTVVISPYAGHFTAHIDQTHWDKLISVLKMKGYTVCTNRGNTEELPLPETEAPFIELQDCVEFVETAGYFIGIRSGFCDLVCVADCLKIVIYETGAPAASINYFGFHNMEIGDQGIIELINDCIHTDNLIEQILAYF